MIPRPPRSTLLPYTALFRSGRFHRLARSGFNVLIPFIERPNSIDVRYFEADVSGVKRLAAGSTTRIDLREHVLNFPSQPVITKDNVTIDIDVVLHYRVAEIGRASRRERVSI